MVKNLPVMQETTVQSLGQEDPLDKGMATHCSILAWRISWTEKPGRHKESNMTEQLTCTQTLFYALLSITSCLNPPEDLLDLWVSCLNIL